MRGLLRPQFSSAAHADASVLLPARARDALHLEDASTGLGVDVTLDGARDVAALVSDGYAVYPRAHRSGATLLHAASPSGLEDFVSFETRPAQASLTYALTPNASVKGLRLVENTLELLDGGGAPRLRVAPPYLVGADGARTDATLAVEGCAADHSPAGPWGRPVTAPGAARCTLRVSWRDAGVVYPAILDPRWTATTNTMNAKRQGHTATLLSNGQVLVAGGTDGTNALSSAELFDRTTGRWTATGSFTGGRQLHTAVQLGTNGNTNTSGKVLLAGGWSGATLSTGAAVNTTQLYSVTLGTWSAATALGTGTTNVRHSHTATLLANGQVLIAGGLSDAATTVLATAATYDPNGTGTGTWTATSAMASKTRFHTATLMTTGAFANKVIVVGGNTGGTTNMAVVQVFTFGASPAWTSAGIAQLPAGREGHRATLLANGQLLITGGKSGTALQSSTLLFNAVSPGAWTSAGTMNATHAGHTATLLSTSTLTSGSVLVAGGAPTTTNSAELWNGTATWTPATALSTVISGHTATLLANNMVLIAGGVTGTGTLNTAQVYDPSFAANCSSNSQCATGFCANGVCCDTACNGGCGACNLTGKVGTCSPVASATVCRPAGTGGCDVAETCNGTALTCPTDAFAAATTTCRTANGACDVAEKCTGTSATCPADGFAPATTSCRNAGGECDVAETCTGTSAACPADAKKASGTACTDDGNLCTTDKCDGTAVTCQHAAGNAGTVCRPAGGECDNAEACTGMSTTCPADTKKASGTTCLDDGSPCTTDKCNGTAVACQHAAGNAGTVCRPVTGECDVQETCTGTTTTCPADTKKPANTACADDGNQCTTDKCDGTAVVCQHPAGNAGTVCRGVAGPCDVAEACTGTSTTCPTNVFLPSTNVCRAANGICDLTETCTGSSAACPPDGFAPTTTVCRQATGVCDVAETCTGAATTCPADALRPNGFLCDDDQLCTNADACLNGVCKGHDVVCTAQDQCHLVGSCNPSTGTCFKPAKPNDTLCDDGDPATSGEKCEAGACRALASYQKASAFAPQDLGDLGGSVTNPVGMNGYGQIVGNATRADGANHAFTWSAPGPMTDLGATPGFPTTSAATDINDSGIITGTLTAANGSHHAFRDVLATVQDLGAIGDDQPDKFGDRGSYASAENAAGDITGYYTNAGGVHAFRSLKSSGSLIDIGGLTGRDTIAYDISDAGMVVGVSGVETPVPGGGIRGLGHAFMADAAFPQPVDLNNFVDPTSGWTLITAKGISPNGTYIVGSGDRAGQLRAYRFNRTTGVLDELSAGWTGDVFPYGVNDEGKVVGTGFPNAASNLTAWTFTDQVGFQSLNDIVGTASGWSFSVATAINAAGDITGYGSHQSLTRAFRLQMGTACPAQCPAFDQCHVGACDPTTGGCTNVPKLNGTTCDDGVASTSDETCQVGVCRSKSTYPTISNLAVDDLGDLGGHSSIASDINSYGEVVGGGTAANGTNQAFIWSSGGPMADLGAESSFLANSGANAINDAGMVVGSTSDGTNGSHVYRYTAATFVEDLGVVGDNSVSTGDVFNYQGATAYDVNESGELVGYFSKQGQTHAYRYSNGVFDDIGSLQGGLTYGWGIDEAGVVVGASWVAGSVKDYTVRRLGHAIIWSEPGTEPTDLNDFVTPASGWVLHSASDISDNGRYIAGTGEINGVLRAFRLDTTTGAIDEVSSFLGDTYATAVNNNGDVAGTGHPDAANTIQAGFIYTDQIGFKNINDTLDPASGWNIEVLNGINEQGDVVGWGDFQGQRPRAVRVHRIVTPQVACAGKAEGDSCDAGNTCGNNNVCHLGVCGGGDPADAFCLRVDGVVEVSPGKWVAVFGYDSTSTATIIPTINEVNRDGSVVANPNPAPPGWLAAGSHPGIFLPPFDAGETISWRVNGQEISATTVDKNLTKVPIGTSGYGVYVGGSLVTIQPDLASYAVAPPEAKPQDEPTFGDIFNGVLTGKIGVTSSGAATYTVPISIPPGLAGMAPNLSLVYSSQGPDGVAGQGWELGGLSMIYRCPKTRIQDGVTAPIRVGFFDSDTGVCLDGKRLFRQSDGTYKPEQEDFSNITVSADGQTFTVVTKAGETRYYGRTTQARVTLPPTDVGHAGENDIVIWALDRVMDNWGNFYDVTYNRPGNEFMYDGIRVTRIDYTGHAKGSAGATDDPTFASVNFSYEMIPGQGDAARPDVRWFRFGNVRLPRKYRLSQISTPAGHYDLTYMPDTDLMLPSRLATVQYCGPSSCMGAMQFGWDGGGYGWQASPLTYDLPISIRTPPGKANGVTFADLNGDGWPELIQAQDGFRTQAVWQNIGTGWDITPEWTLPANLADANSKPKGTLFVDFDGDGKLDEVADAATPGTTVPKIWLNRVENSHQTFGWVSQDWNLPTGWPAVRFLPPSDSTAYVDTMVDMDGDGRADLVRLIPNHFGTLPPGQRGFPPPVPAELRVLLNTAAGWQDAPKYTFSTSGLPGQASDYRLEDANRDGLPDLVGKTVVGLNTQLPGANGSAWKSTPSLYDSFHDQGTGNRLRGDIDGDGQFDVLVTKPALANPASCAVADGVVALQPFTPTVSFATGSGFVSDPGSYVAAAAQFLPPPFDVTIHNYASCDPKADTLAGSFLFNLADVNGDGLADIVLSHPVKNASVGTSTGQVLVNNGSTWVDLNGATTFQNFATAANSLPDVPTADPNWATGATFIDINGDGLVDITGAGLGYTTYLNTFKPPIIKTFPAGLAQPTQVDYSVITTSAARFSGGDWTTVSTYSDSDALAPGTRHLTMPLRVVKTVTSEDKRNVGATTQVSYHYDSLRGDTGGRGSMGFKSMTVIDHATQTMTTSTFAQAYPYVGMVTDVARTAIGGNFLTHGALSDTHTTYCDSSLANGATPTCTPPTGASGGYYPPGTSPFVYVQSIDDKAHAWKNHVGDGTSGGYADNRTYSTFAYDDKGNPTETSVVLTGVNGDSYTKTTDNTYGTATSRERLLGKVTQVKVTSTGPNGTLTHITEFDYSAINTYYPDDSGVGQSSFALTKTRLEPYSTDQGIQQHTAFAYDRYGNVTTTTSCASNFDNCRAGASNNSDMLDSLNPPFRTTLVSYSTSDFNWPTNVGIYGLNYGNGRFPVKLTNAAGQVEYRAYDPFNGLTVETTDANGINTCYTYDEFRRETTESSRCGSDTPVTTTSFRYTTTNADPAPSKVVTVVHPPVGGASWIFSDAFGQKVASRGRSFDGGFTEAVTTYDSLGRVASESKPYIVGQGPTYKATPVYDVLNRLDHVTQDLGSIDGLGSNRTSLVKTTYDGSTVSTDEIVNLQHETRSVTKNALGRESNVTDANQNSIQYGYDADGNLTDTYDPRFNNTHVVYDIRGRKSSVTDPDLGQWTYLYNGFGDVIAQAEANGVVVSMSYDQLGREITKTDYLGTSYWLYDQGPGGVGKVSAMISAPSTNLNGSCAIPYASSVSYLAGVDGGQRTVKQFTYTAFGQPETTQECTDGDAFITNYEYDIYGRQAKLVYPAINGSRLSLSYNYTSLGFLQYIADAADGTLYWAPTAMNASGQVTDEFTRNGVRTQSARDDATGWLLGSTSTSQADGDRVLQKWEYHFDEVGNLLWRGRSDAVNDAPSEETFSYDLLNRLSTANVSITDSYDKSDSYSYDELGNIQTKSGAGYNYGTCTAGQRPIGPHAVCSVDGGPSYNYDSNGNMSSASDGRSVQYDASNKAIKIQKAGTTVTFAYGADGNRVVQNAEAVGNPALARTVYVGLGATGKSLYERTSNGSATEHVQFLYAADLHGGNAFAFRTVSDDGTGKRSAEMKYYHYDHLGSVTAISDEKGDVSQASPQSPSAGLLGYTPWGERRNPDGTSSDTGTFAVPAGHRAFTGHETIPDVGLINMNGRIYDPVLARFLTPDPNVQFSADLQSYNRYSYVLNNPLRYNDPTGYFSFFDGAILVFEVAVAVVSIYACPVTAGATCAVAIAIFSTTLAAIDMAANGASWQQIALASAVSLAAGYFGGLAGGAIAGGNGLWGAMIGGAVAGAMSSAITSMVMNQQLSVVNILEGAAMGAAMGALAYEHSTSVSQASAKGGGTQEAKTENAEIKDAQSQKTGMLKQMGDSLLDYIETTASDYADDFEDGLERYYEQQNAAARQRIADSAMNLASDGGGEYGTKNEYDGDYKVAVGKYKCNIYVHDVLDEAGIPNKMMVANVWGNPNSDIPGWVQVDYSDAEPGDVAAFARSGGHHGHVGIIVAAGPPSALAASDYGVISTGTFSAPHVNASAPVVWRWTGM